MERNMIYAESQLLLPSAQAEIQQNEAASGVKMPVVSMPMKCVP